jgi:hypothetical protein
MTDMANLGAFAKQLRTATISFIISFRQQGTAQIHLMVLSDILCLKLITKFADTFGFG